MSKSRDCIEEYYRLVFEMKPEGRTERQMRRSLAGFYVTLGNFLTAAHYLLNRDWDEEDLTELRNLTAQLEAAQKIGDHELKVVMDAAQTLWSQQ